MSKTIEVSDEVLKYLNRHVGEVLYGIHGDSHKRGFKGPWVRVHLDEIVDVAKGIAFDMSVKPFDTGHRDDNQSSWSDVIAEVYERCRVQEARAAANPKRLA